MAKTALQAVNLLRSLLQKSLLMTHFYRPNGKIYKYQRPTGSKAEDVVINSLPLNRSALQRGILNVNLFVPNLTSDTALPNITRLEQIETLMELVFAEGDVWSADGTHQFTIDNQNLFPDENSQHYLNFRIEFTNVNLN